MQKLLTIEAPAKINLTLDVLGKRDDGYHELETVMHQIDICDLITLEACPRGISLTTNSDEIPVGEDNLAYKAALAILKKQGSGAGVKINIAKNIPVGAGMAGGSTDAAAVLVGINYLYSYNYSKSQLMEIAATIGSDVAFCLSGKYFEPHPGFIMSCGSTAIARGRGEIISPLPTTYIPFILVVKPSFELSTASIYAEFDLSKVSQRPETSIFLQAWANNDLNTISAYMVNVLESVSIRKSPEIGVIKRRMIELGAINALMCGSGPSVFAIFSDADVANQAYSVFKQEYTQVYLVSSYQRGGAKCAT